MQTSGGFESQLAGKIYFWRTADFWRIFWRILPLFCRTIFVWRIWQIYGGFELSVLIFALFCQSALKACSPPRILYSVATA
jgi:hypothetical protein